MSKITEEEESKSQNNAIPSEVLRSAMKIAFIYASKYRHVIIVTKDKKLQQLAEGQKMISVDYEGNTREKKKILIFFKDWKHFLENKRNEEVEFKVINRAIICNCFL